MLINQQSCKSQTTKGGQFVPLLYLETVIMILDEILAQVAVVYNFRSASFVSIHQPTFTLSFPPNSSLVGKNDLSLLLALQHALCLIKGNTKYIGMGWPLYL